MGKTKTDEFTVRDVRIARYAKALAHPARVAIIRFLVKSSDCMCGSIVDHLPLSQSTVSQHLKELKEAGLIKGDIDGTSVCYCVDQENWQEATKTLTALLTEIKTAAKNCC